MVMLNCGFRGHRRKRRESLPDEEKPTIPPVGG
jgi:hypothetical protein